MSMDDSSTLSRTSKARLDPLTAEFDALLDRMQTPESRRGMKAAFDATAEELSRATLQLLRRN
jgi:antitoxin Phd